VKPAGPLGPGNRTEFLPEAMLYAEAGAVSVLIDYPGVRPEPHRRAQGHDLNGLRPLRPVFEQRMNALP